MQIDGHTVVLCGILIRTLLAILFLSFWIKDRQATWFAWWSAAFFLGDRKMMASDMDKGLAQMKTVVEAPSKPSA